MLLISICHFLLLEPNHHRALTWSKYKPINASIKNNKFEFTASAWKNEPAKGECSVVNSPSGGYFQKPPR
jgi:hypothetical protein